MTDPYGARPYSAQPYGQQPYNAAPEHPQGTIVLVLGIVGFFVGVTAPFAWYLGSKAMKEIKATGSTYSNQTQLNVGKILGIVMTIVFAVSLLLVVAIAVLALVATS